MSETLLNALTLFDKLIGTFTFLIGEMKNLKVMPVRVNYFKKIAEK